MIVSFSSPRLSLFRILLLIDDGVHPFLRPCRKELLVVVVVVFDDGDLNSVDESFLLLGYGELTDLRFFDRSGVSAFLPLLCRVGCFSPTPKETALLRDVAVATTPPPS